MTECDTDWMEAVNKENYKKLLTKRNITPELPAEGRWFWHSSDGTEKQSFAANTNADGGSGKKPACSDQRSLPQELHPRSGMRPRHPLSSMRLVLPDGHATMAPFLQVFFFFKVDTYLWFKNQSSQGFFF